MKKTLISCVLAIALAPMMTLAQEQFSTPEKAASALAQALSQQDTTALNAVLGDRWQTFLPPEGVDQEAIARFLRDWKIGHQVVQEGNIAHLNVGLDNWQLPVPMVKTSAGWHFDMLKASDEILTRAIGRNELAAIEAMHAYVDAQDSYYQMNHTYAQKFISSEGKKDGLYWPAQSGETPSPLGPSFSPEDIGTGYHGYHFRILTAQGPDATGGEKNYLADGQMNDGFALIAWPVSYGQTGIMSFIIDRDDRVFQANFGEQTEKTVSSITRFDPDKHWQPLAP